VKIEIRRACDKEPFYLLGSPRHDTPMNLLAGDRD
jgi:hypothetical protein